MITWFHYTYSTQLEETQSWFDFYIIWFISWYSFWQWVFPKIGKSLKTGCDATVVKFTFEPYITLLVYVHFTISRNKVDIYTDSDNYLLLHKEYRSVAILRDKYPKFVTLSIYLSINLIYRGRIKTNLFLTKKNQSGLIAHNSTIHR